MNRTVLVVLLTGLPLLLQANPSFTIGSNPYFTFFAYPHDILKWPDSGAFVTFNPTTMPWQGNVTDLARRPNESYVNNYQQIEFAPPSGYEGNPEDIRSWMKVSSYAYERAFTLGGVHNIRLGKIYLELGHTSTDMELQSQGVGRAYEDHGDTRTYDLVPFKGETNGARSETKLQFIYANQLFNQPVGLKIRYVKKNSTRPDGYINFSREGRTYELSHLTWGWATTGCNHIFGYSHINTDAFFQDSYSVLGGYQADIQGSFEINGNFKTGIRYRRNFQQGENYRWKYNDGSDFEGDYYVDPYWKDQINDNLLRAYSKVRFWQFGDMDAGILFFLQYASHNTKKVNKVTESDPGSLEGGKEIAIEANPFINYKFKGGYTDFGVLLEVARTGFENTSTRWNSVSQSDQTNVLWSTTPYNGWSPYWENFSYGNELFFATGFESHSSIGIYKRLSLLVTLTVLKKYTREVKVYGKSEIPEDGSSYTFDETHERLNHKNETWMNGSFGVAYGRGPVQLIALLTLPRAYLLKQATELSDTSETLFDHEKRNMWQVQDPTTFRLFLIYAFGNPH